MVSEPLRVSSWTAERLAELERLRGWTPQQIAQLGLRYDGGSHPVVFPVCDETLERVGELRYQPDPARRSDDAPKMLAKKGTPRELFPPPESIADDEPTDGIVLLLEGEPDVVRAWSLGLAAVAVPGAANWRPDWAARFSGRRWLIVVCFDCDEAGRTNARRAASDLVANGVDARVVDLDPTRDDGYDLTDFLAAATTPEQRAQSRRLLIEIVAATPMFDTAEQPPDPFRSHSRPYIGGNGNGLPFRPLGVALADAPEEPDWTVQGMVARTLVTALGGRPKVGKSTLLFGLLRAVANGEAFLGQSTEQTRALLLTEERHLTLNEKRRLFELADDDVHVLMRHEALVGWDEVVAEATSYCLEHDLGVLVVDTWDKWAELRSDAENNAGDTLTSLAPLMRAAGVGLAVVIVAHQRKGDGKHGEALRGSNAFAGTVDVILELERDRGSFGEEGGRILYGTSRLMGTPEKVALAWDGETGVYTASDYDAVAFAADKARVTEILDDEERTRPEIANRVGKIRSERLLAVLNALVDDEEVAYRTGRGVKGSPFRWRLRGDEHVDEGEADQLALNDSDAEEEPAP